MVKAHFTRKFLSDNGVMTELTELTAVREDGEPQLNLMKEITEHVEALVRSGVTAMIKLVPMVQSANKDLQAANIDSSGDDSGSGDDSSGDDSGGGDEFGGGDDFGGDGLGGDMPEDEPAPEDTPADPDAKEEEKPEEEPKEEEPEDESEEK